jgi:NDP-sugar pyrophosphorylase family protein
MEKLYTQERFFAMPSDGYFIDIGIPEDYARAQNEL